MAGLPHYITSKASIQKFEPVFLNQFEVIITPPPAIPVPAGLPGNGNILLEHVKRISGLAVDINPGETNQTFKFAKRYFSGAAPAKTGVDVSIEFTVNLDNSTSMYVYKVFREWADLLYNPLTGAQGLKINYCGNMVINVFNKQGDVHRRITLKDVFIANRLKPMELSYLGTELYTLEVQFASDYFDDVFV